MALICLEREERWRMILSDDVSSGFRLPEMGKWDMAAEALFPYLLCSVLSFVTQWLGLSHDWP
jgi:hypothetical protein